MFLGIKVARNQGFRVARLTRTKVSRCQDFEISKKVSRHKCFEV
jgi:hypothetical protein